jgi:hypothetical protein
MTRRIGIIYFCTAPNDIVAASAVFYFRKKKKRSRLKSSEKSFLSCTFAEIFA